VPLYIAGAKILSFNPCSIPFHGTALNITVQSYCDSMDFGLIACRRALPDLGKLADYMETGLAELEVAVANGVKELTAPPPPAPRAAAVAAAKAARQRKSKTKRGAAPAKRASAKPSRKK
jgi:hypothetical protein